MYMAKAMMGYCTNVLLCRRKVLLMDFCDDTLLVPAAIVVMLVLSLVSVKNVWYDCVD